MGVALTGEQLSRYFAGREISCRGCGVVIEQIDDWPLMAVPDQVVFDCEGCLLMKAAYAVLGQPSRATLQQAS
jgi:hypothetical protein